MDLGELTYPDGYGEPSDPLVSRYERLIWHNQEICNNCYQQVRAIGEILEKRTDLFTHRFNAYYERTEHGSQEFDPFSLPSDRYGRCYCLDCGSDLRATSDPRDMDALAERGQRIADYIDDTTDHDINQRAVGRTIRDLKAEPANQGYDSEILAAATCVGLARAETDAGTPKARA